MSKQATPKKKVRAKSIETMSLRLLSAANRKFQKSLTPKQSVVGLSLASADVSGYELCPRRSPGCTNVCLMNEGFGHMPSVKDSRISRSISFVEQRSDFLNHLHYDLQRIEAAAAVMQRDVYVRLNVFSDLAWEAIDPTLFQYHLSYYDYSKREDRMDRFLDSRLPSNYTLIFSQSELNQNYAQSVLQRGGNINVIYREPDKAPPELYGYPTDKSMDTDLWWLDKSSTVGIGQALGAAMQDTSGFVVD